MEKSNPYKAEMETIGGYSMQNIITYALIAIGVLAALIILSRTFSKKEDKHTQKLACQMFGWNGQVSRYAGRCPKCNAPLGDRLIDQNR